MTHEGALHLEDTLCHRTRLTYEKRDRGLEAAKSIADIMGGLLKWNKEKKQQELAAYEARCKAEAAAAQVEDEAEAQRIRDHHGEVTPM